MPPQENFRSAKLETKKQTNCVSMIVYSQTSQVHALVNHVASNKSALMYKTRFSVKCIRLSNIGMRVALHSFLFAPDAIDLIGAFSINALKS
jgi:hypothetical protein